MGKKKSIKEQEEEIISQIKPIIKRYPDFRIMLFNKDTTLEYFVKNITVNR